MNATSDLYELEGELDGVCVVCREDCGSTLNAAGYCYSCNEKEKENEK